MTETQIYTKYVDLILAWLKASSVSVDIAAYHLPLTTLGRCYNSTDDGRVHIEINAPNAREALFALAHEAGHWLGNEVFGHKKTSEEREDQAHTYGWRVLMLVGADNVVTMNEWKTFHPSRVVTTKKFPKAGFYIPLAGNRVYKITGTSEGNLMFHEGAWVQLPAYAVPSIVGLKFYYEHVDTKPENLPDTQ